MDTGLLTDSQTGEWDFFSVDENVWHGNLLCLADISWHSGLPPTQLTSTITYALQVCPQKTKLM